MGWEKKFYIELHEKYFRITWTGTKLGLILGTPKLARMPIYDQGGNANSKLISGLTLGHTGLLNYGLNWLYIGLNNYL